MPDTPARPTLLQRVVLWILGAVLFYIVALYPNVLMARFQPDDVVHYGFLKWLAVVFLLYWVASKLFFTERPADTRPGRQTLAVMAAVLLLVGVFSPIVSFSFVGDVDFFRSGYGDGYILLLMAAAALALAVTGRWKQVIVPALGSLAVILWTFLGVQETISEARSGGSPELAGNPHAGLAPATMASIQWEWGWILLFAGSGLLVYSAARRDEFADAPPPLVAVPVEDEPEAAPAEEAPAGAPAEPTAAEGSAEEPAAAACRGGWRAGGSHGSGRGSCRGIGGGNCRRSGGGARGGHGGACRRGGDRTAGSGGGGERRRERSPRRPRTRRRRRSPKPRPARRNRAADDSAAAEAQAPSTEPDEAEAPAAETVDAAADTDTEEESETTQAASATEENEPAPAEAEAAGGAAEAASPPPESAGSDAESGGAASESDETLGRDASGGSGRGNRRQRERRNERRGVEADWEREERMRR